MNRPRTKKFDDNHKTTHQKLLAGRFILISTTYIFYIISSFYKRPSFFQLADVTHQN